MYKINIIILYYSTDIFIIFENWLKRAICIIPWIISHKRELNANRVRECCNLWRCNRSKRIVIHLTSPIIFTHYFVTFVSRRCYIHHFRQHIRTREKREKYGGVPNQKQKYAKRNVTLPETTARVVRMDVHADRDGWNETNSLPIENLAANMIARRRVAFRLTLAIFYYANEERTCPHENL